MECWVWREPWLRGYPHKRVCVGGRAWGWVCFWCLCCQAVTPLWLFLLEFSSDGFYPPATSNSMGLEGGPPCEMVPDSVVAKVSTASLPFWHLVWDQQPKCAVVCTAVICIVAVLLGAAQGGSALHWFSSFSSRRALPGAVSQAWECLLDQALCPSVHHSPLCYTHYPQHCTK